MAEDGKPKAKSRSSVVKKETGMSKQEITAEERRQKEQVKNEKLVTKEKEKQLKLDKEAAKLRKDRLKETKLEVDANTKNTNSKLAQSAAEKMGRGKQGTVLATLSRLEKGENDTDFFRKELSGQEKAASILMGSVKSNISGVNTAITAFKAATGDVSAQLELLAWTIDQTVESIVEGFTLMQESQKTAAYRTNFNRAELYDSSKYYMAAAGLLNRGIADAVQKVGDSANKIIAGYGDELEKNIAASTMMNPFAITKITTNEALEAFNAIIKEFKDVSLVNNLEFAKLVVGLQEMGYSISGPLGQFMKSQYYRDTELKTQISKMDRTNEILNKLVGLSKESTMSLDELVSIMSETMEVQNLSTWTLMRSGMGAEQAMKLATSYGTSKAAITAAADTLGLSKSGVEAIFAMMNEIISSATDPTKLGELTRKYQVGGLTGGKSISQVYNELAGGNFTKVFLDAVRSATEVAQDKSMLGFEYIASQFGSSISTVLGSLPATAVSKLINNIEEFTFNVSDSGRENADLLGEIQQSIINAPVTVEDILNSIFDVFVQVGAHVSGLLGVVQDIFNALNPLSWFDKLKDALSGGEGENSDLKIAVEEFGSIVRSGLLDYSTTSLIKSNQELFKQAITESPMSSFTGTSSEYFNKIANTIRSKLVPSNTEVPSNGGVGQMLDISDYYMTDTSGWFVNNDIRGASPFRLTAGYMAPAYKAKFGSTHYGVDYGAKTGTPIPSPVDGQVVEVGFNSSAGNYAVVQDGSGRRHTFAHMSKVLVKRGDYVSAGEDLGLVGATGMATGPHVHYAVKENGRPVNPNTWAGYSFGGIPLPTNATSMYAGTGNAGQDNNYALAKPTTSDSGNYYNTNDVVDSINNLNEMLSTKLDMILAKMSSGGTRNPFSYK